MDTAKMPEDDVYLESNRKLCLGRDWGFDLLLWGCIVYAVVGHTECLNNFMDLASSLCYVSHLLPWHGMFSR